MSRFFKSKKKVVAAALLVLFALLAAWAFWLEPASVTVTHVNLRVPRWHAEHRGLKLAVLTDLHVGSPHVGLDKLARVVGRTNEERPDVVLLLGDFVIGGKRDEGGEGGGVLGGTFVEPEPIAEELKRLRAPLGVYAVLGNHDYWSDGEGVRRVFERAGIGVLRNTLGPRREGWMPDAKRPSVAAS